LLKIKNNEEILDEIYYVYKVLTTSREYLTKMLPVYNIEKTPDTKGQVRDV